MTGADEAAARERIRRRLWGTCAATDRAHVWRTTADLGYGQELLCLTCDETGWLDYGR